MRRVILFLLCAVMPLTGFASYRADSQNSSLGDFFLGRDSSHVKILIMADLLKNSKSKSEKQSIRTQLKVEFLLLFDRIDAMIEGTLDYDRCSSKESMQKCKAARIELQYMMDSVLGR